MSKHVLIISTSFRRNGNSEKMALEFQRGAEEAGNETELVQLRDISMKYCHGCFGCRTRHSCIHHDEAAGLVNKMHDADVLVFASPLYFHGVTGQMKTLLDRTVPIMDLNNAFTDVYLLLSSAETDEYGTEEAERTVNNWLRHFPSAKLKDIAFADCVKYTEQINGHPALKKAYELGKNI